MPSNTELRVEQKRRLYQLLKIKQRMEERGDKELLVLEEFIQATIVEMDKEDVAWVREQIAVGK